MKLASWALAAAISMQSVAAFLVSYPAFVTSRSSSLRMSDDDDWFTDFDPAVYDQGGDQTYGNSWKGNRGDRGRSLADHDYTRDTSRDNSNVDEDAVNGLLVERVRAKKRRDFDLADEIRDQLLSEFAVGVNDKDLTWRTGCSSSGSGMRRGSGYGTNSIGRERGRRRDRNFGPNGHDYDKSSDAGPNTSSLSEERIHSMIAERLQAKLNRSFDTADRLQCELVNAGVYVHDGMKQWRSDGVPFGDFDSRGGKPGKTKGSWSDRNGAYEKSAYSVDIEGKAEDQIAELVEERSKCKAARDYLNADRIRDELRDRFDVYIDDRLREWSVGNNFGEDHNTQRAISQSMKTRGYVKSESSADLLTPADEVYVQTRINERQEAKNVGDYDTADSIRDELLADFDIVIHDKLRKWSVGGDFGDELPKRFGEYTRRGGGDLSDDDVATIKSMVKQRVRAKKDRNFDVADEIKDLLRDTYQVIIDDRSREWRVDSYEYVQSPVGPGARELNEEEIAIIQAKLVERAAMKRERDYEAADAIRDELLDTFSVMIDDRTKEWKTVEVNGADFGDKFIADAKKSQTSPFKSKQLDNELDDALIAIFESGADGDSKDSSTSIELVDGSEDPDVDGSEDPDDADISSTMSRDDLMSLKVVDLKEKLREAGKPVSGNKTELVDRLLALSDY